MPASSDLQPGELKKRVLFWDYLDVLVPGSVAKTVPVEAIRDILSCLQALEKRGPFRQYLVLPFHENVAEEKLRESGLAEYFAAENIRWITRAHVDAKAEVDRKLYEQNLEADAEYTDDYFMQTVINGVAETGSVAKDEMQLVCNDVWTGGFYTRRFSGIDFAIVEKTMAVRGKPAEKKIPGLTYIDLSWEDIEKLLRGLFPKASYAALDAFVSSTIKEALLKDTDFSGLAGKAARAAAGTASNGSNAGAWDGTVRQN